MITRATKRAVAVINAPTEMAMRVGVPDMTTSQVSRFPGKASEHGRQQLADMLQHPGRDEREAGEEEEGCHISGNRNAVDAG